jgi:CheY-like chemotaxis protein
MQGLEITESMLQGSGTILIVDDEEMVLDVGSQLLLKMGYSVLTASSGMEAIEQYMNHKDRVKLIILDLAMPHMDGEETFKHLKAINPRIKVLLSTGFNPDGEVSEILKQGCQGSIQKPYRLNELSLKIREILNDN